MNINLKIKNPYLSCKLSNDDKVIINNYFFYKCDSEALNYPTSLKYDGEKWIEYKTWISKDTIITASGINENEFLNLQKN